MKCVFLHLQISDQRLKPFNSDRVGNCQEHFLIMLYLFVEFGALVAHRGRPHVAGGGSMSGACGLRSSLALDSSIWSISARRSAAFPIRATASLGSFVDCANSRSVAA